MTKKDKVLNHLETFGRATVRDLLQYVNNPMEFIRMLRNEGKKIQTVDVPGKNYKIYVLN